jgi:uncharacterized phage protein (TIGR02216 family)
MRAGLGSLRLSPDVFWAMTPRELEAALIGAFGMPRDASMSSGELSMLMAMYPDAG